MSITDNLMEQSPPFSDIDSESPASVSSEATPARFTIDLENSGVACLTDYALYDTILEGSHPHVWGAHGPLAPTDELPAAEMLISYFPSEATIVRSITVERNVEIIGSGDGYVAQLCYSTSWFVIRVAAKSPAAARAVGRAMRDALPHPVEKPLDPARVGVHIWHSLRGVHQTREEVVVSPSWEEIAHHYTASTRSQLDELMALAPADGVLGAGRIVLFTGPPGVGKTSAIKTLARAWAGWSVFEAVQNPERMFHDQDYLTEVTERPAPKMLNAGDSRTFRTVVIEDVDHFVSVSARSGGEPAIGRLLNIADGWTGASNLLIVLSSNLPSGQMLPAITRPGRCLTDIAFGLLKPKEAKFILAEDATTPRGDLSLADVFQLRNGSVVSKVVDDRATGYL